MGASPDPARFGKSVVDSLMAFIPVIDGDVLPAHPLAAIRGGAGHDVPLLTGTNAEEFRLFLVPGGFAAMVTDEALPAILGALGLSQDVAALYRADRAGASAGDVLCAMLTDRFFRLPALAVAEARVDAPAPTYLYEFAWRSPVLELGAAHALEIPFVFDNLHTADAESAIGSAPPAKLAQDMHATWVSFAATGDPGWEPFDSRYPVMTWDGQTADLVLDPRGPERLSWQAD
jgi:para-nitrobenzyl esterase